MQKHRLRPTNGSELKKQGFRHTRLFVAWLLVFTLLVGVSATNYAVTAFIDLELGVEYTDEVDFDKIRTVGSDLVLTLVSNAETQLNLNYTVYAEFNGVEFDGLVLWTAVDQKQAVTLIGAAGSSDLYVQVSH